MKKTQPETSLTISQYTPIWHETSDHIFPFLFFYPQHNKINQPILGLSLTNYYHSYSFSTKRENDDSSMRTAPTNLLHLLLILPKRASLILSSPSFPSFLSPLSSKTPPPQRAQNPVEKSPKIQPANHFQNKKKREREEGSGGRNENILWADRTEKG